MNRRSFLGLLGGLGAASATSYFFAPIGGWKSDVIAKPHTLWWIDDPRNIPAIKKALGLSQPTEAEWKAGKPMTLYGIPYYYSDAAHGPYIGVARSHT